MDEDPSNVEHPPYGRDDQSRRSPNGSLLRATPGLVRIGVTAWWRTTVWAVRSSARAYARALNAAASGEPPSEILRSTRDEARRYARRALGVVGMEDAVKAPARDVHVSSSNGSSEELRERGAELLRHSADVHFEADAHPAYERILEELAPDEGRILRLLAREGPQPTVDVRTGVLPIKAGSELIASGLSMIGAEAGCRYPDRVASYLNNLFRLGLIWFSREPVSDPLRYQVLEAQPEVIDAMKEAKRSRTVRRSIHLTPFGHDFCDLCLPLDGETGEHEPVEPPSEPYEPEV
jgi:hypothetical protein